MSPGCCHLWLSGAIRGCGDLPSCSPGSSRPSSAWDTSPTAARYWGYDSSPRAYHEDMNGAVDPDGDGPRRLRLLSVVAPVYNEEALIEKFYGRVCSALEGLPFELVLVDDGSMDSSA